MQEPVRFAELMACLAAACELAMGQDEQQALHGTAVALRLGRACGLAGSELRDVYYQSLLRFVGCNADTELMSAIAGDVIELRRAVAPLDTTDTRAMLAMLIGRLRAEHAGDGALASVGAVLRGLLQSARLQSEVFPGHCEVAQRLGQRLGFGPRFVTGLGQLYARWDGRGVPGVAGEAVLPAVRVVTLAQDIVIHQRLGGWQAVAHVIAQRAGRQYDPQLAALALRQGDALVADLPHDNAALWALEPEPHETLQGERLDQALGVLADYAEIQSTWFAGHAVRVARLAEAAAVSLDMPGDRRQNLRRAALLHDIGRVGISAGTWARGGPLSARERDSVQRHSLHSQQLLMRAPALAPLARLAGAAHERHDGSGYPHGQRASELDARLLAAADVVAALGEARPHRPAHDAQAQHRIVADEVRGGRLDAEAANAVLAAAGIDTVAAPAAGLPAGLSAREAAVLGELACGRTNKEIARRLGISPKTVGRHLESVYLKAGVRTRAGATLFALEHRLVRRD